MAPRHLPGIFCLEGEWNSDPRARESVVPLLQLLEQLKVAKTIHRDVATQAELTYYLKKWGQARYADYKVLYLAAHGDAAELYLGQDTVGLDELGRLLEDKCRGRVVYFGSCLTLNQTDDRLLAFAKQTGAKAVIGYSTEIDWLDSAAFELLLLDRLSRGNRSDAFFRTMIREHGRFAHDLGLVLATKSVVLDAPAPDC